MKRLSAVIAILLCVGCAEKKPLTAEEQWHGYCKSVGNAARSIMLDRQNAITKDKAVEHANKVEDETTKKFVFEIIDYVYSLPESEIKVNQQEVRDQLRDKFTQKCIATPHQGLPDYKPF